MSNGPVPRASEAGEPAESKPSGSDVPPSSAAPHVTLDETDWWPEVAPPPTLPVIAVVLMLSIVADVALRLPVPSMAWSLGVVVVVGLLVAAGRINSFTQQLGAAITLSAGGLLSVRDSAWVASVLVLAIAALVVLLAADGLALGQRRPWLRSADDGLRASMSGPLWYWRGLSARGGPRLTAHGAVVARTTFVVAVVVTLLAALLASGDAAFGWLFSGLGGLEVGSWVGHGVAIALLLVPSSGLALLAVRAEQRVLTDEIEHHDGDDDGDQGRRPFRVESLAAVWATSVVLVVWCVMQVVVALGASVVLEKQGVTAAEHARQGFFQLVAAAALALTVLNIAHRTMRAGTRPDPTERMPAVVIGSALFALIVVTFGRLAFYVDAFGLTMLRLSVATFLGWLALMTVLSVARSFGLRSDRNWLPTAAVMSAALFAVAYGIANPEMWVARVNLERAAAGRSLDVSYLVWHLGNDAKPTVAAFDWHESQLGERPESVTRWLCESSDDGGYGPLGWNHSRSVDNCPG